MACFLCLIFCLALVVSLNRLLDFLLESSRYLAKVAKIIESSLIDSWNCRSSSHLVTCLSAWVRSQLITLAFFPQNWSKQSIPLTLQVLLVLCAGGGDILFRTLVYPEIGLLFQWSRVLIFVLCRKSGVGSPEAGSLVV
jgi:hypothetical protein